MDHWTCVSECVCVKVSLSATAMSLGVHKEVFVLEYAYVFSHIL